MALESAYTGSDTDLEALLDVEATIPFTNSNNLARTLRDRFYDNDCDYTILVTGIPSKDFIIDDDNDESPIPKNSKSLYFKDLKLLRITMPKYPHEVTSYEFTYHLASKLDRMNCYEEIGGTASMRVDMERLSKEPDGSWGPRQGKTTCVLEIAFSQSDRQLHRDAKIWIENPQSEVTQVITIKIYRTRPEIVFIVWRQTQGGGNQVQAIIDQEIHVKRVGGSPTAEKDLCLSFRLLAKREPYRGTAEKDLVFSTRELEGISRFIWEKMTFP